MNPYQQRAECLVELLRSYAATYPQILTVESPFDLFKIDPELTRKIDALNLSLAQAGWALARVKACYAPRDT